MLFLAYGWHIRELLSLDVRSTRCSLILVVNLNNTGIRIQEVKTGRKSLKVVKFFCNFPTVATTSLWWCHLYQRDLCGGESAGWHRLVPRCTKWETTPKCAVYQQSLHHFCKRCHAWWWQWQVLNCLYHISQFCELARSTGPVWLTWNQKCATKSAAISIFSAKWWAMSKHTSSNEYLWQP